ncbi:MAG: UxaA family hydrolase [Gammaproteobacteria bacterium]|nr:UxaA family hydrolase [Gammaproteobacteria bacterium]
MGTVELRDIGRIPVDGDNVAIATKPLDAGTRFLFRDRAPVISHTMLEGHRFAVEPIAEGAFLQSWGLPFGRALRVIEAGEYVCNAGILEALRLRNLDFALPDRPNFADYTATHRLDEKSFQPGTQVPLHAHRGTFEGYSRPGGRGIGTRNVIVILGTTSLTGSFAGALESRFKSEAGRHGNLDGITAVAHTEGGGQGRPNNLEFLLRTLAGFMVHPNVGAVLAIDYGTEAITNAMLEEYLRAHDYPLDHVLHRFYSIQREYASALGECEQIVRDWLPAVSAMPRSSQPLTGLKVGLQCGGSDAFSGVSGNPLAGWVARELIRHGGTASLAETDELIGAEPYILANTRDLSTARRFLEKIEIFKERVAWHGQSAEGNPTGGNKFRGLYNIAIKSIGAARKKDPDVRLDHVIDYSERMTEPGFYFMDSPGNDLESIAGQVASGCNLIFFTTGNGSITNFPFVPTVKFITTTGRWNLLSRDMDVNAGRYLDGTPMADLGVETFRYTVDVASGTRSVGERAGHSQVSIWRDWRQTDGSRVEELRKRRDPDGRPIPIRAGQGGKARIRAMPAGNKFATDRVGLILPTSLCAGQIARQIAERLNAAIPPWTRGVSRFFALPHTEGCGASSGENEEHQLRTVIGHLLHPFVEAALLLEHGCERTHNDLMRHALQQRGIDPARFGYASIQLDGGIDKVVHKVEQWFTAKLPSGPAAERREVGLEALSLGLISVGPVSAAVAAALGQIAGAIVGAGGCVVVAENASLLRSAEFLGELGLNDSPQPTLAYGQDSREAGLHVMATPTDHGVEILTGLGGTGVQLILAHVQGPPLQGHPMIPVLQAASDAETARRSAADLDCVIDPERQAADRIRADLLKLVCDTASHDYEPRLWKAGCTDFQLTRGLLGVSL